MSSRRRCLDCREFIYEGSRCGPCRQSREIKRTAQRLLSEPWRVAYNSPDWTKAVKRCLSRDDWQCRAKLPDGSRCPETTALEAHHIVPLASIWQSGGDPYRLSNLATLCKRHHAMADAARREG